MATAKTLALWLVCLSALVAACEDGDFESTLPQAAEISSGNSSTSEPSTTAQTTESSSPAPNTPTTTSVTNTSSSVDDQLDAEIARRERAQSSSSARQAPPASPTSTASSAGSAPAPAPTATPAAPSAPRRTTRVELVQESAIYGDDTTSAPASSQNAINGFCGGVLAPFNGPISPFVGWLDSAPPVSQSQAGGRTMRLRFTGGVVTGLQPLAFVISVNTGRGLGQVINLSAIRNPLGQDISVAPQLVRYRGPWGNCMAPVVPDDMTEHVVSVLVPGDGMRITIDAVRREADGQYRACGSNQWTLTPNQWTTGGEALPIRPSDFAHCFRN